MARAPLSDALTRAKDGLMNIITGIGTEKDKTYHTKYAFVPLTDDQLMSAYRGDWIARKIVDIPAKDATREWRDWQAEDDQITALEEEERRLGIRWKLREAMALGRLLGGAVMIMGVKGDKDPSKELDLDRVSEGGLLYVHVLGRTELNAQEINRDPLSERYFGEPVKYTLSGTTQNITDIHPSRVVRIIGNHVPRAFNSNEAWGDSVLQAVDDAVKHAGMVSGALASMIQDAKTDIVKMPDFMDNLGTADYEKKLLDRFSLASLSRAVTNTYIIDGEEDYQRVQTNFTALPDAVKLYLLIASGAADIPASRMLGQTAVGLNSTGDNDIRNYYDMIADLQESTLRPALSTLDEVVKRSAGIKKPEDVFYEWSPLWQMDEEQKAKVAKDKAEAVRIYHDTGLIRNEVLAEGVVNMLIEDGTFPGLDVRAEEAALKEEDFEEREENSIERLKLAAQQKGPDDDQAGRGFEDHKRRVADARPRSLYVRRDVLNGDEIVAWAKSQGFSTTLDPKDMHVTICFSKTPVDWLKVGAPYREGEWGKPDDGQLRIPPGGPRVVEEWDAATGGKVIVLQFSSTSLQYRHEDIRQVAGASWDFPEYTPHVTITYSKPDGLDVSKVVPYRGAIELGPEVFEEINEDWRHGVREIRVTGGDATPPSSPPIVLNVSVDGKQTQRVIKRIKRDPLTGDAVIEYEDGGECGTIHDPETGRFMGSRPCSETMARPPHPEEEDYYKNRPPPFDYPNLEDFQVAEDENPVYNCAADAFGDTANWWWPDVGQFWPQDAYKGASVDSFDELLLNKFKGEETASIEYEEGFTKIALYGKQLTSEYVAPTHLARQLPDGSWSSKMGSMDRLIIPTPTALEGGMYGDIQKIYKLPDAEWQRIRVYGEENAR